MLCFEVYRNGQKLCTAGIGDFGVLTALLTWVSHEPEKLARWAAEGIPETEPSTLEFTVGGLGRCVGEAGEHLKWVEENLAAGDEIRIRVVEVASADPPSRRYEDDPEFVEEQRKQYVRKTAKELGWEIATGPDAEDEAGTS
jgi:hypothetical protein